MKIDLRTSVRSLVLSHLDRGNDEALSIWFTVRSEIWVVDEHFLPSVIESVNGDDEGGFPEPFSVATVQCVISRPSNYTRVYRKYSVRGYGDDVVEPMKLVADHDSCWVDGILDAVKEASKQATQMAKNEAKSLVRSEYLEWYERSQPHVHLHIDEATRCRIRGVYEKDGGVEIALDPTGNTTRFS